VNSGGDADITKFHSFQHPFYTALICLPFSCYLVSSKMGKVELDELSEFQRHILEVLRQPFKKMITPINTRYTRKCLQPHDVGGGTRMYASINAISYGMAGLREGAPVGRSLERCPIRCMG
jgi:Magnesium chelatase, subunit ChlI